MATNILMPALSPTMEEGKLAKWLVKEGDTVKSGDILAEIETDKATMEFEAVDEGKIGKILVPEGSEGVKVNAPIAVLLDEGEKRGCCRRHRRRDEVDQGGGARRGETGGARGEAANSGAESRRASSGKARTGACGQGKRIFASPLARRIAAGRASICRRCPARPARPHRQVRCRERPSPGAKPSAPPRSADAASAARRRSDDRASRRCRTPGLLQAGGLTKRSRTTRCARPSPSA